MFLPIFTALWIGILTSISPCPLATNIAAISFVSYRITNKNIIFLSGIFYTIGRSITYAILGFLIVKVMINIPILSDFLQRYINKLLGIILIIVGMFLLGLLKINLPSISVSENWQKRVDKAGILGSIFLGLLFALAFCPVSAALFFGSLIPIAVKAESSVVLPLIYGIGTGLPVVGFAILIMIGAECINKIYHKVAKIEFYTKRITGVIFILVGVYYVLSYIFEVF